ncbi:metal-sensitive transcriptional regulator [Nocardioides sp. TRM66260-LWL]|uniref:metal-sensitive transcriptional regulator n=1 Tax=Nocardioides sp. TRM66260-LWL TaxID=2874478 RepID=UPI001CC356C3|nr:metal-sensitive transcriptional regulator [Nocardioides sp. TRM66260-LWL]MBZ5734640.1 metal-sensitive transcriptional regulator [Nocardioides sp. TRM66260-LWL]
MKRAQGQLGGVLRMVEEGRDVEDVVNQLRAVVRALDRAALALVAVELRARLADPAGLGEDEIARLEKLLLSVA